MILTDIHELKSILEIDPGNKVEDKKLLFLIEMASDWIEEYTNRKFFWKSRTEYYDGTGTQELRLRARPVYTTPTIAVRVDEGGYFGSVTNSFGTNTALTYGDDFALRLDQEDGTSSRSGILVRIDDIWPRPRIRQRGLLSPSIGRGYGTIKVTYTAGYSVDTLPATIRLACNLLVARLRVILPLGAESTSEGYEDRSISIVTSEKTKLMALVRPLLVAHRNWNFGHGT